MLSVTNLSSGYGNREVLHQVTIEVSAGELVAVVGANGAGKSTLLNTIAGLVEAKAGTVHCDGTDVTGFVAYKRVHHGLSLVPEGRHVFPLMSVKDNLTLAVKGRRGKLAEWSLDDIFDLYPNLKARQKAFAGNLSGGEQQMLAIARSLLLNPRYVLLDEPSTGLAPRIVAEVMGTALKLKNRGIGVLLVEQNVQAVARVADLIYVLEQGDVVWRGKTDELMQNDVLRKAYLGA